MILVIVLVFVMMVILNMQNINCYWPDRKVIEVDLGIMVLAVVFVIMVLVIMKKQLELLLTGWEGNHGEFGDDFADYCEDDNKDIDRFAIWSWWSSETCYVVI